MADDAKTDAPADAPAKPAKAADQIADLATRVAALEDQVKGLAKLVKYDIPARLHILEEAAPKADAKPAKGGDKTEARFAAIEAAVGIRQPEAE